VLLSPTSQTSSGGHGHRPGIPSGLESAPALNVRILPAHLHGTSLQCRVYALMLQCRLLEVVASVATAERTLALSLVSGERTSTTNRALKFN